MSTKTKNIIFNTVSLSVQMLLLWNPLLRLTKLKNVRFEIVWFDKYVERRITQLLAFSKINWNSFKISNEPFCSDRHQQLFEGLNLPPKDKTRYNMHILVTYFSTGLFEIEIIKICYNIVFGVKNRTFNLFLEVRYVYLCNNITTPINSFDASKRKLLF